MEFLPGTVFHQKAMNRSSDALDTLRRERIILVAEGAAVDRIGWAYIFAPIPYYPTF